MLKLVKNESTPYVSTRYRLTPAFNLRLGDWLSRTGDTTVRAICVHPNGIVELTVQFGDDTIGRMHGIPAKQNFKVYV